MESAKSLLSLITIACLSIMPVTLAAAECSAKSGAQITPLLELYTSEGCSSCPPADEWFSHIKADSQKVTPLAFHVDYWDYIGWKDRFAKAQYSERQRKTAAFNGASFVYTPQFSLNGRDFRGRGDARLNQEIMQTAQAARANLDLRASLQANGETLVQASVQVVNTADIPYAEIFIATYENQLVSQVNAGENSGRELRHDYVVRDLLGAYPLANGNAFSKNILLPATWKNRHGGVVMFVQDLRNGGILQSLQLPFCS